MMPRGGKRPGAGRKPKGETVLAYKVGVGFEKQDAAVLEKEAAKRKMTITDLVRDIVRRWISKRRGP